MTFNLSSMCGQSIEGLVIVMKDNVNINGIDYVIIQDTEFRRWKGWGRWAKTEQVL